MLLYVRTGVNCTFFWNRKLFLEELFLERLTSKRADVILLRGACAVAELAALVVRAGRVPVERARP